MHTTKHICCMQLYFAIEQLAPPKMPEVSRVISRKRTIKHSGLIRPIDSGRPSTHAMLYWLAEACKRARENEGRIQVHIAASLNQAQSSVTRFENHDGQPRDLDAMVAAYAEDLDIEPVQLWTKALDLWTANGGGKED